jgi:hypothetical protein
MLLPEPLLRSIVATRPQSVEDLCRIGMPQNVAYEVGIAVLEAVGAPRDD